MTALRELTCLTRRAYSSMMPGMLSRLHHQMATQFSKSMVCNMEDERTEHKDCPQGSIRSPLLRNTIVDEALGMDMPAGVKIHGVSLS